MSASSSDRAHVHDQRLAGCPRALPQLRVQAHNAVDQDEAVHGGRVSTHAGTPELERLSAALGRRDDDRITRGSICKAPEEGMMTTTEARTAI